VYVTADRSDTMQTIFPILRYNDARAAIRWLCSVLGFRVLFTVPETGDFVRHAQLNLGTNLIMLGSSRDDSLQSPQANGVATQAIYVYVADVDEHFETARLAGAEITMPLHETDFGAREYHLRDLEGHPWTFGSYLPNADVAHTETPG
jgi:uncharacterized glyoxalase superfamily protein PhnB